MKHPHQPVQLTDDEFDNETTEKPLDFERILKFEVGEFGPYQILIAISVGLISAFASFFSVNFLFVAAIPEHRYS